MGVPIDPTLLAALGGRQPASLPSYISRVEVCTIGELAMPTREVVASDPVVFHTISFVRRAPQGRFPVRVAVAHFTHPAAEPTVAGACLEFVPAPPELWEMALFPGNDPTAQLPGHIFGYGVDSGTGCFMDRAAAEELEVLEAVSLDRVHQLVRSATRPDYEWPRPYGMAKVGGGLNIAVFQSGMGDGCYASYWGLRSGEPVCLVTDFRLLATGGSRLAEPPSTADGRA